MTVARATPPDETNSLPPLLISDPLATPPPRTNSLPALLTVVPLAKPLEEKTLEAWLTLPTLEQQGGGAITVESSSGAVFDGIVYGERDSGQWMAGSNGYARTQSFNGTPESDPFTDPAQIVVVYSADRTITAYRNGRQYGKPYRAPAPALFDAFSEEKWITIRLVYADATTEILRTRGYHDRYHGGRSSPFNMCLKGKAPYVNLRRPVP